MIDMMHGQIILNINAIFVPNITLVFFIFDYFIVIYPIHWKKQTVSVGHRYVHACLQGVMVVVVVRERMIGTLMADVLT
jgi:hypothetical protein